MSDCETPRQFHKRLWKEGKYHAYVEAVEKIQKQLGVPAREARDLAMEQFPPPLPQGDRGQQLGESEVVETSVAAESRRGPETGDGVPRGKKPPSSPSRPVTFGPKAASFSEQLQWVMEAVGRFQAGLHPKPKDCPGADTWGLLQWALKARKDFYGLWVQEMRRQRDAQVDERQEAQQTCRSVAEIDQMLRELE